MRPDAGRHRPRNEGCDQQVAAELDRNQEALIGQRGRVEEHQRRDERQGIHEDEGRERHQDCAAELLRPERFAADPSVCPRDEHDEYRDEDEENHGRDAGGIRHVEAQVEPARHRVPHQPRVDRVGMPPQAAGRTRSPCERVQEVPPDERQWSRGSHRGSSPQAPPRISGAHEDRDPGRDPGAHADVTGERCEDHQPDGDGQGSSAGSGCGARAREERAETQGNEQRLREQIARQAQGMQVAEEWVRLRRRSQHRQRAERDERDDVWAREPPERERDHSDQGRQRDAVHDAHRVRRIDPNRTRDRDRDGVERRVIDERHALAERDLLCRAIPASFGNEGGGEATPVDEVLGGGCVNRAVGCQRHPRVREPQRPQRGETEGKNCYRRVHPAVGVGARSRRAEVSHGRRRRRRGVVSAHGHSFQPGASHRCGPPRERGLPAGFPNCDSVGRKDESVRTALSSVTATPFCVYQTTPMTARDASADATYMYTRAGGR